MSVLLDTRTGPIYQADGAGDQPIRQGRFGAVIVTDAHGRYHEATSRGNVYTASNQAAQAVSVALATTYTGLCISNPLGNTKQISLLACSYALTVAPAGIASLHIIGGYSATTNVTHTTPLVAPGIQNSLLGVGPPSSMKADSAATIPAPGYILPLVSGFTAAALPSMSLAIIDLAGQIILPPGAFVAIGALTAVTGFGAFTWEEMPI